MRVASLLIFAALSACGSPSRSDESRSQAPPTKECDAYIDAYRGCMNRLSPLSPAIAAGRADNARHALEGITDNARLRKTCVDGLAQLQTSCH
jgi:hypothetical protein